MAAKLAGRSELTQLMTNHILCNVHRDELITIMNSNGMPNKVRGYH